MISPSGIALIKKHEQCRLTSYQDPAGVWTIGWGHTSPAIGSGLEWTQEQADAALQEDLGRFDHAVTVTCPETTQGQHDAMCSLAYNIGAGAFAKSSVAKLHNAGEFGQACQAFGLWNHAGGKVLLELVHRRAEEAAMYAAASTIPEGVRVDVPVDAEGPKPVMASKTIISTATAGLGTAASVASQIHDQAATMRGMADNFEDTVDTGFHFWTMFGQHIGLVALVLVVIGLGGIVYDYWIRHKTGRS